MRIRKNKAQFATFILYGFVEQFIGRGFQMYVLMYTSQLR